MGRMNIALKFNEMVRNGEIGPVMLGRDHHDTGGTDSPFRETSNIKDGSNIMADMAVQCYAGNAARGMSLIALHNGGGTGIGRAVNGGFGMVLDGSERVDAILKMSMPWDPDVVVVVLVPAVVGEDVLRRRRVGLVQVLALPGQAAPAEGAVAEVKEAGAQDVLHVGGEHEAVQVVLPVTRRRSMWTS